MLLDKYCPQFNFQRMDNCMFCQIVDKKLPAKIIYENENVLCFLPKEVESYGHTLVIPKKHYADLYDIPTETLCELIKVVHHLPLQYKIKINTTGMNILHASGKEGQQSVFHFHFHLLPRYKDDGINNWPRLKRNEYDKDEIWGKLRME